MERRRHASVISTLLSIVVLTGMAALTVACEENPVGRECFTGLDEGNPEQAIVASPALECQSRVCLRVPQDNPTLPEGSEYASLCTAECGSDEDCDRVPESPCQTGFACMVPTVVGSFCCRKLCVCKDYLILPVPPEPQACDPSIADNQCCNLEGRPECEPPPPPPDPGPAPDAGNEPPPDAGSEPPPPPDAGPAPDAETV